jgi:hypothetical protein
MDTGIRTRIGLFLGHFKNFDKEGSELGSSGALISGLRQRHFLLLMALLDHVIAGS